MLTTEINNSNSKCNENGNANDNKYNKKMIINSALHLLSQYANLFEFSIESLTTNASNLSISNPKAWGF